ncbi:hypothetical protein [Clostridium sp. BJN0001]|uniref:hypothetical protein n=1 Tax=Clostridium sp. BJN0001 TaxID=2930219 RepID=UPI001FD1D0BD|nr:hypothetical protein [Clostridium sp. BJN0001]
MENNQIIKYLEDNYVENIIEEKKDVNYVILSFEYAFDKESYEAARSYANEESDYEQESEEWYNEYYYPYLKDLATDDVSAIIEDMQDELNVFAIYNTESSSRAGFVQFKFLVAVSDEIDVDELEDILNDYD